MKKLRYILMLMAVMMMTVGEVWGAITPTAPTQVDGVYQIGTAEELWGFAQGVNNGTIAVSANAKLTCETSIDLGGSANGSFPGIGSSSKVYTGTFDGNGKTITGYYQSCTSTFSTGLGFFKNVKNATIKNFTLAGTLSITGSSNTSAFLGGVIGKAETSQVVDVTSTVDINTDNTVSGEADKGIRIVGGVAAWSNGSTFTRCRYNGTMTLYSKDVSVGIGDRFAGIVGFAQNGATTIENCLFDGKIEAFSNSLKIAGIMGRNDLTASAITNCLSVGTLKLLTVNTTTGMIMGYSNKQPVITNSYYTKDKFTVNNVEVGSTGYNTAGTLNDGSDWESLTNTLNNNAVVGETANWKIVSGQDYPIPMEYTVEAAGPYTITFDTKGGTPIDPIIQDYGTPVTAPADPTKTGYVFAGWDREIPATMPGANITITAQWTYTPVEGYYLISTKEDFFNFVTVASTNTAANAKLLEDIDLDEETFNGFNGYTGTFDGNKKTISGYKRTFASGSSSLGFFNTTSGATIKDFTLEGEEIYNINSACYAIGSVIGMSTNTTIEGVTSNVKMTFGANCPSGTGGIRVVGGLVGRISGGSINKCRYKGTIDLSANGGISDRFGGIVGDLGKASTISNCLFDGEIKVAATSNLAMGGILGTRNSQTATISHCLFNGKMTFPAGANISNCGPVSGGTGVTASDSYYDMTGFTVGGVKQAKTAVQQSSSIERTTQPWIDICVALNNGSSNWGIETEVYPVPGDKSATNYTITFDSNGGSEVAQISLPEGAAITAPEDPTWTGHTFTGWEPTLPATMPAENITVTAQWELTKYAVNYYVDGVLTFTDMVEYSTAITPHTAPTKERYTFSGWSEIPSTMPANDIRVDGTFTFSPNAEGVFEIGNQEDLFNFAAYVNATGLGTGNGHGNANGKLIADIELDGATPFPGIGKYVSGDLSYAYTGTFDGQGHSITGYVRNVTTNTNQGGFFNYVNGATVKNFSLAGEMTVSCNAGQQYGSVIGWSEAGSTVEDIHSSVNVTITNTASQVGGFTGRAGGTYNRCRYSGTVSTSTAYNKIGGFAGSHRAGTTTNCLFDGTLNVSTSNDGLIAGGFTSSIIEAVPNSITNCLAHGTITITNKNAKCGIIFGFADKNVTLSNALYTTTGAAGLDAIGTVTGATMTGVAKDVTLEEWTNITIILNPTSGTDGNWEIKSEQEYPVPSKCTIVEHTHIFNDNGFCISDDGAYEEATIDTYGWYEVNNAGKLWWLVTNVNNGTLSKNIRIKLTTDIDMEGVAHGSWPGFCVQTNDDWATGFQGIFDGQGYTIRNYYYNDPGSSRYRRGFFNTVYNATIRKVKFEGTMYAYAGTTLQGVVIGSASGTSKIEDITSSVNIITNGTSGCGGVAGSMENVNTALTEMNRCRYNGTITLGGNGNTSVGGVVGELRSAVMKNCLFDGTITKQPTATYTNVGGLVGKVTRYDNSEIHRCLTHGTITINAYDSINSPSGIVVGAADKTIYMYRCYHTATNVTTGLPFIGPHFVNKEIKNEKDGTVGAIIPYNQLLGESSDLSADLDSLYKPGFRTLLGESNWAEVAQTTGSYTYPLKDEEHIHKYKNGFCIAGDGEYEKPNSMGKIYQIQNGGQLYWFATQFNEGNIPQDAEVQLLKDIDMEGSNYIYPGIGSQKYPFKGIFDGMGHAIGRYYRDIVNAEYTGLINYAVGATIKDVSIYGEINFNLASVKSFHGTVLGCGINGDTKTNPADTMLITDVFSFVNINCSNANVRVLGGIAGRTSGGIHRSRYHGIIKGMGTVEGADDYYSASGRQIGGIVANAKERILISDCLFDGQIWVNCQEADTMRVSGILASNEKNSGVKIIIKNCLFNGCLKLQHTYEQGTHGTGVKSTQNGIIAGYWDSNLPKVINNVYYLKTCSGMDDINIGNWEGKKQQGGSTIVTTEIKSDNPDVWDSEKNEPKWNEIFQSLDEFNINTDPETGKTDTTRNGNWTYVVSGGGGSEEIPVPGGHICHHVHEDGTSAYNEFGYCTICGAARPLEKDDDGKYKLELVSDLASFRDMVNDGDLTEGTILDCKMTQDIDFSKWDADFGEPIGNSNFNRYLYNFDGQGYKLLNVKITTDDEYVGFFGFAGDDTHDCVIHDLTITGEIIVPYDSKNNDDKPMHMGVVGKMYRGKIYNVHSYLTMRNTNATRAKIGGLVGCIETSEENSVVVDKCSYSGTCYANAAGNMGGIVGETSNNTEVKNCTFAGTMIHTYQGVNNSTNFSGIVGYNEAASFQGVQNCVIAGTMKTDENRVFVNYGETGNHKNVLCGEDRIITDGPTEEYKNRYSGNYAWNAYAKPGLIPTNSIVYPEFVPYDRFVNGEICAIMNAKDDDPTDIQDGHPWGQVLGYQLDLSNVSTTGSFIGNHTDGSPAQRVPYPGWFADSVKQADDTYIVVKRCYKVVKDASNNYTADYYYFDDAGDAMPLPTDAAGMSIKKVDYTRPENYVKGYMSVCMPFAVTKAMLPHDAKVYQLGNIERNSLGEPLVVEFTEDDNYTGDDFTITAGTPVIIGVPNSTGENPWPVLIDHLNTAGAPTPLALNPSHGFQYSYNTTNKEWEVNRNEQEGINGSFNTVSTGTGYYKLNTAGTEVVHTTTGSHAYPYRAYIKLPGDAGSMPERIAVRFVNAEKTQTELTGLPENEADTEVRKYMLDGRLIIERGGKRYSVTGCRL